MTIVNLTLSVEQDYALQPPAIDTYQPVAINLTNCAAVTSVKEKILSLAQIRYIGCHDELKTVDVTFRSRNRSQCCAIYLPPLVKLTFIIEITAGTILTINALQQSEGSFIPMDPKAAKILSVVQSILSTSLMLPLVLSGPGAQYMGEFGGRIDTFFSKLCYKRPRIMHEDKPEEKQEEQEEKNFF